VMYNTLEFFQYLWIQLEEIYSSSIISYSASSGNASYSSSPYMEDEEHRGLSEPPFGIIVVLFAGWLNWNLLPIILNYL
jgi:hypothetical protein